MFEQLTLAQLLDLGLSGILLAFVIVLWLRLNKVTDRQLEKAEQAEAERKVIAREIGLTTGQFSTLSAIERAKLKGQEETD